MKFLVQFSLLATMLLMFSCKENEMKIDPHLEANSKKFYMEIEKDHSDDLITYGHFSSYNKEFGLAWMGDNGIDAFFSDEELLTFSTDNNDNYVYDNVLAETKSLEKINKYIEKFGIPIDRIDQFHKAFLGYFYAPHDEYSMVYIKKTENDIIGFLSNGFDIYEILPIFDEGNQELLGYHFKLNNEYVGSLQTSGKKIFRMTNEYCDATEIILANIASMIIKTENL